jgi:hypothetical protein
MLSLSATAPMVNSLYIIVEQPVKPFDKLIKAVLLVESAGDTLAFIIDEEAVGCLQIRSIRLSDYNQWTGKNYKMKGFQHFPDLK